MKFGKLVAATAVVALAALMVSACRAELYAQKALPTVSSETVIDAPAKQPVQQGQPQTPVATRQVKKIILTGSEIPQTIRRTGRITNGMNPVTVFDRAAIEHSGATSVAGVLRTDPDIFIRFGGR